MDLQRELDQLVSRYGTDPNTIKLAETLRRVGQDFGLLSAPVMKFDGCSEKERLIYIEGVERGVELVLTQLSLTWDAPHITDAREQMEPILAILRGPTPASRE